MRMNPYILSIFVQFWIKFGMLPLKLLSLTRLHLNDIHLCQRLENWYEEEVCIRSLK